MKNETAALARHLRKDFRLAFVRRIRHAERDRENVLMHNRYS